MRESPIETDRTSLLAVVACYSLLPVVLLSSIDCYLTPLAVVKNFVDNKYKWEDLEEWEEIVL